MFRLKSLYHRIPIEDVVYHAQPLSYCLFEISLRHSCATQYVIDPRWFSQGTYNSSFSVLSSLLRNVDESRCWYLVVLECTHRLHREALLARVCCAP